MEPLISDKEIDGDDLLMYDMSRRYHSMPDGHAHSSFCDNNQSDSLGYDRENSKRKTKSHLGDHGIVENSNTRQNNHRISLLNAKKQKEC